MGWGGGDRACAVGEVGEGELKAILLPDRVKKVHSNHQRGRGVMGLKWFVKDGAVQASIWLFGSGTTLWRASLGPWNNDVRLTLLKYP
jgi:hypothetical protein